MNVSLSTGFYYTKSYKEILDVISYTSCSNIELFLNQAFIDVPVDELAREIAKRKLDVLSIHTPLEFIAFPRHESEEFWIDKCISLSKTFNSKIIVTHMVLGKYFIEAPQGLDYIHRENMVKFNKLKDICVTTENLPYFTDGSFLGKKNEFVKFIKDNNTSITFDTTHCAYSNHSILDMFIEIKDFVKNIHISDFKFGMEHKVLGTGDLPLKEFLYMLRINDYQGNLTIELDFDNKKRNDIKDFKEAVEQIEKSIQYIKANIC